jgi:hypothetical protein
MKTLKKSLLGLALMWISMAAHGQNKENFNIQVVQSFELESKVGKLRAVPVQIASDKTAILVSYSADKEIDPFIEMFYPPTDNLKFALYSLEGELIWKKELAPGTINGIWFTPIYPFDMNNDGTDEIYYVHNTDSVHILSYNSLRLKALDARSGRTIGQWPWKKPVHNERLSHTFRNFIMGGYVKGEPVLVTAQGTYGRMGLQAWNKNMELRWDLTIEKDDPGARGSHMSPVIDINHDKIDEILWGERCISLDDGDYLFIADKNEYRGHSDVIQPTLNRSTKEWSIFTCRESGSKGQIKPRVVMYDHNGKRMWSDLEKGHMDMGWTAHVKSNESSTLAFTISRGGKVAGPDGFYRLDVQEYAYNAWNGQKINLPFKAYNTIPVDLNGDGYHEFACALGEQADRKIYNASGETIGDLGKKAYIAMASKFMKLPGEQILTYHPDGTVKIWADKNANASDVARERYNNPYYKAAQSLTATGYNLVNLGGL